MDDRRRDYFGTPVRDEEAAARADVVGRDRDVGDQLPYARRLRATAPPRTMAYART